MHISLRSVVLLLGLMMLASACMLPHFAHAQCATGANGFVPLACTEQSSKLGQLYASGTLSTFVNGLFKFSIAIGAIAAVLRIAYAGALYMGTDLWDKKGQAKKIMGDAIIGLLLLLCIWLILYQINPDILQLNAIRNIQPIPTGPAPTTP